LLPTAGENGRGEFVYAVLGSARKQELASNENSRSRFTPDCLGTWTELEARQHPQSSNGKMGTSRRAPMNLLTLLVPLLSGAAVSLTPGAASTKPPALSTVGSVDLSRYAGKWYEIARYPNRFQRDCESDVSAVYTLRANGKVQVVNACRKKDGSLKEARGTAKVVDRSSNARLKVSFFWPFYGDYWIIGLDPEYRWAVVGEPGRKYLWVLSRATRMDDTEYQKALQVITAASYDPARLVKTKQSATE
jgi:apolipoprotein D and lipocalin family protein